MPKDKVIRTVLVLILILLCLNLLKSNLASPLFYIEAQAEIERDLDAQIINLNEMTGITCSNDGKYVYVLGEFFDAWEEKENRKCIFRSENFGIPGSWKMMAKEKIDF